MSDLLIALFLMSGLGVLLSMGMALADRRLHVEFDPRIDALTGMLPGTNCGVCGRSGCRSFAEAIIAGLSAPSACSVSGPAGAKALAKHLSAGSGAATRQVARLACAGGSNVARNRAVYHHAESCRGAALIAGGGKGCLWGCLGLGDCEAVCTAGAIRMNEHHLPVVEEARCTACNDCVEVCPKDLFSIHPTSHHLWVACKSLAEGDAALAECAVACTGCAKCASDAERGGVTMDGALPVVDYGRNAVFSQEIIQRCPTGAIVWIGDNGSVEKGAASPPVIRRSPLPVMTIDRP